RIKGPSGRKVVEGAYRERLITEQEGSLAKVIEEQRGQYARKPNPSDRTSAEMPHIGVEGLSSGDHQKHRTKYDRAMPSVRQEESDCVRWIDGQQHFAGLGDGNDAEYAQAGEP